MLALTLILSVLVAPSERALAQRFVERARLRPDRFAAFDAFGAAVAIDGDTLVVGAPSGDGSGAAYVFDLGGAPPRLLFRFAPDGSVQLGASVSVRGELIAIGSPGDPVEGRAGVGSVFLLRRAGDTLTLIGRVFPNTTTAGRGFGAAVAVVSRDEVVVGEPGAHGAALITGVTTSPFVAASVGVGTSRIGGRVAAGPLADGGLVALLGTDDASSVEATYLWVVRSPGSSLLGAIPNPGDEPSFGNALAFDGTYAAIGSPARDVVHFYAIDPAALPAVATFISDLRLSELGSVGFGAAVALDGESVIVGAPEARPPFGDRGAAVAYSLTRSAWRYALRTSPPELSRLGVALARSGSRLVVGAPESAEAILFEDVGPTECESDAACAGELCLDGYCCDRACGTDASDCSSCARDEDPGWCGAELAGTACGAPLCSAVCDGAGMCEVLECADGGAVIPDGGVVTPDAGAALDAAAPLDAQALAVVPSFHGGGGCRCSAGVRETPRSCALLTTLALVLATIRRRRA